MLIVLRWLRFGSFLQAPGSPAVGGPLGATLHWAISASETHSVPLSLLPQSQTLICPAPLCSLLIEVLVFQQWPCLLSSERDMWGRFALLQVTGWKCVPPLTSLGFTFEWEELETRASGLAPTLHPAWHDPGTWQVCQTMNEPKDGGDEDDRPLCSKSSMLIHLILTPTLRQETRYPHVIGEEMRCHEIQSKETLGLRFKRKHSLGLKRGHLEWLNYIVLPH